MAVQRRQCEVEGEGPPALGQGRGYCRLLGLGGDPLQSEKDPNQKEDKGESPSLSLSEHDISFACRAMVTLNVKGQLCH
jgi:hypothetical protein